MNRQALNVTIEHFTNITVGAVKEAVASLPKQEIEAPEQPSGARLGWHQHVLFSCVDLPVC